HREHTFLSDLASSAVRVPHTVLLCGDASVLGEPFYVIDNVEGTPYRHRDQLVPLGAERTRRIAEAMIDTLAELHAVDHVAVGLADFGRPEGFLERQLRRWGKQLDASRSRDIPRSEEHTSELQSRENLVCR